MPLQREVNHIEFSNVENHSALQFVEERYDPTRTACSVSTAGTENANFGCVLNELILAGDESAILDGATVLPDDIVDGREEPKMTRGRVVDQAAIMGG